MTYHTLKKVLLTYIFKKSTLRYETTLRRLYALAYRGRNVYCPICDIGFRKFIPLNPEKAVTNLLCPQCGSAQRQRLLWLYLLNECGILTFPLTILHLSPRLCLIKKLKSIKGLTYYTSDLNAKNMDLARDL